ncbi:AlwI family type II restriction endonuclease [Capnocytophaga granulosa]|uniref:AlwI family type II restriction endonuclease n=1 Tax=Capnocytophaga granulosa TaxID=45242 RepID=UPI003857DA57
MKKRNAEYKPLLFTTTVRNPQRLKGLLWVLKKFDKETLTDEVATKVIGELIRYGLYRPMHITPAIREKWKSSPKGEFADTLLSEEEVTYILAHNPQSHKEAGFSKGYPSRFATLFDFPKELGFVYYEPNKPIAFSELGTKFSQIYEVQQEGENIVTQEKHPEYEQQAFLQAMCKYQRSNPFVRVLNDNIPLILLLETIKKLNADPAYNGAGISRKELPLLIFWKDNNAQELYQRIKLLRESHGYTPSDEVIIDICTQEIIQDFKQFKPKSIIDEYPDEFIRKMRLTGLISLRGGGRFIDINHNENEKIAYILKTYSSYKKYHTEKAYFNYMAKVDKQLFAIHSKKNEASKNEILLQQWVQQYPWPILKEELNNLALRKVSKDAILKFLPNPVRLEFLIALSIKSSLPSVRVIPNYPTDDTGLPTATAGGNMGDITCLEHNKGVLVEVTMAEGRTQTIMEIWPIERHLEDFKKHFSENSQCIFVAPSIFSDSMRQIQFVKQDKGHYIRPYKISAFIHFLENTQQLYSSEISLC